MSILIAHERALILVPRCELFSNNKMMPRILKDVEESRANYQCAYDPRNC
uniref:Uncharacterized protein n=1 Tax=Arundo donax TaxID=35708 RepID=A0A0A8Z6V0_ARUDO